jgi:tetratricopeptide (TPR) repeat protein
MEIRHTSFIVFIAFLLASICAGNCFAKIDCKQIGSYKDLIASGICKGKGEVHHLIERRFADCLGVDQDLIPSICLSKEQHRHYTNLWRDEIPYATKYSSCIVGAFAAFAKIYRDDPCVIKQLTEYLAKKQLGRLTELAKNVVKNPLVWRSMTLTSSVVIAYEVYDIFSSLDESFHNDEYIGKALISSLTSIDLNERGETENAKRKLGESYFFLGYACFHKMLQYRTEYHKEIADQFSDQSRDLKEKAVYFLKQSVSLNDTIPYGFFYLGEIFLMEDNIPDAQRYFDTAAALFASDNNGEFLQITTKRLNEIESRRPSR